MHRRKFIKTASGVVAATGVGSVKACSGNESKGDPVVSELEIQEQISDGDRGAMLVSGEVLRLPQEYAQVEVLMQFRDEQGESIIKIQEANETPGQEKWEFSQSWFAEASRVEAIDHITATIEVHQ